MTNILHLIDKEIKWKKSDSQNNHAFDIYNLQLIRDEAIKLIDRCAELEREKQQKQNDLIFGIEGSRRK